MNYIKKNWKEWLTIIAGIFFSAAGTSMFFTPCKIVDGGITGISTILFHMIGFPIGVSYAIINVILLLSGYKILGKHFVIKTVVGTGIMSLFMDMLSVIPTLTENAILAAVTGGILYGVGRALNFMAGASTGGIDILGRIIQTKYPKIGLGKILLPIDASIIALSYMVFRRLDLILLGIFGAFIQSVIIDLMMKGLKRGNSEKMNEAEQGELT